MAELEQLRKRAYDLLQLVTEPSDEEKIELRGKRRLVFLPITSQSYSQVVAENEGYFWDHELDYANTKPVLRDFVPPVTVEVGLRETDLVLPGSFRVPRGVALQMIEGYSQELEAEFPDFRAIMLPVTGYARANRAYSERNFGKALFKNYFAWGLDDLADMYAAVAGPADRTGRFRVFGWPADLGYGLLGAVPAVVKTNSK